MSVVARQAPADLHGRYIFAYRHFRTNQVIYTFRRAIKQRDINAQLPDLGANNKPAEVRADLWKPFWTLIFPENTSDYRQGELVYEELRKWRWKREIAGERPPDLARPYTEEEIEAVRDRMEKRGGSKKETAFDIIARAKRRLRVRSIMDQKPNSVADLAHVLSQQREIAEKTGKRRQEKLRPLELSTLWYNGNDYQKKADEVVERLRTAQQKLQDIYKDHPDQILTTPTVLKLRAEVKRLKNKLTVIMFAGKIVMQTKLDHAKAEGYTVGELPTFDVEPYLKRAHWRYTPPAGEAPVAQTDPLSGVPEELITGDVIKPKLPTFLGTGKPVPEELWLSNKKAIQDRMKRSKIAEFSTSGIEIRWENPLDAEYAKSWPEGVIHRPMGITRNLASKPWMPPLLTAADWAERGRVKQDALRLRRREYEVGVGEAKSTSVRRNADGTLEHIYRELRQELGSKGAAQPKKAAKPRKKEAVASKAKLAKIFQNHAIELTKNIRNRPKVETIPIYDAPTATHTSTQARAQA